MAYRVHKLDGDQINRSAIRRTRRIIRAGLDHRLYHALMNISGVNNATLDHFRLHIINSVSGKPLSRPDGTSTENFLRLMSGLEMSVDTRESYDNEGELYPSNMAELSTAFPWMYQINLLSMQTMLGVSMISSGVRPREVSSIRDSLAHSWMGDSEYETMLDNLCTILVTPISSLVRKGAGGPPIKATADLSFLINMEAEESLDYMFGTMFIADMVFNHL